MAVVVVFVVLLYTSLTDFEYSFCQVGRKEHVLDE